ncbi:response regulator [Aureimonas sp. ME7]|uniref:response regulator n=1 Tax=Aureimonas sp. ME7 TaxID=2744252 RepID=UPI0015F427CF|nr:response regulator [Aureimonas sp. ME7]
MPSCLVIDESEIVIKVATRILADIDLQVEGSSDIDAAVAAVDRMGEGPELILLSASLPDTAVDAAVRRLRQDPRLAKTKILVSMVEANLGTMTRSKRAGADGFILRPFDRRSLLAWVDPFVPVAA